MYLKLNNGVIEKYPYSIGELRRDNPQTSFPKNPSDPLLADWGVFPVKPTGRPEVDYTKNVTEGTPVRQKARNADGTFKADNPDTPENEAWEWVQVWNITDATAEEIEQRTQDQANTVRTERNQLLAECDWTQLPDAPVDVQAWAVYRQELRNVPDQPTFPWNVTWPTKP
jgi:hypothetical protein